MCGIVGSMSSFLTKVEIGLFEDLFVTSTLRGHNGAGCVVVPGYNHSAKKPHPIKIIRSEYTAADILYNTDDYDKAIQSINTHVLLGHSRFPTKGGTAVENIHPFQCGNIIGMHNGTMDTVMGTAIPKDASDSHYLFEAINNHGPKDVIKNSKGPMALVWIDIANQTLNFYRNENRPMFVARPRMDATTMHWASELGMLEFCLARASSIKYDYFELTPHRIFTFGMYRNGPQKPLVSEEVKYLNAPFVVSGSNESTTKGEASASGNTSVPSVPFQGQTQLALPAPTPRWDPTLGKYFYSNGKEVEPSKVVAAAIQEYDEERWMKHHGPQTYSVRNKTSDNMQYETVVGQTVSRHKLDEVLMNGCASCGLQYDYIDYSLAKTHWTHRDCFVCDVCYNTDPVMKALVRDGNNFNHLN